MATRGTAGYHALLAQVESDSDSNADADATLSAGAQAHALPLFGSVPSSVTRACAYVGETWHGSVDGCLAELRRVVACDAHTGRWDAGTDGGTPIGAGRRLLDVINDMFGVLRFGTSAISVEGRVLPVGHGYKIGREMWHAIHEKWDVPISGDAVLGWLALAVTPDNLVHACPHITAGIRACNLTNNAAKIVYRRPIPGNPRASGLLIKRCAHTGVFVERTKGALQKWAARHDPTKARETASAILGDPSFCVALEGVAERANFFCGLLDSGDEPYGMGCDWGDDPLEVVARWRPKGQGRLIPIAQAVYDEVCSGFNADK